jgi:hypothetical protein
MKQLATKMALFIAMAAGIVSCKKEVIGEGPVRTETRTVNNFSSIDLQMNGNVYYQNAPTWKVDVSAKASIHDILETTVNNGRLIVRYRNGKTYDNDESIRINVSGPGVNSFSLNTSGNIFCLNPLQTDYLYLRSSGSGNIVLQHVDANTIDAESKQSGRISATGGFTISEKLKTDGSGKIDLSAISSKNVTARIIGSGDIKVKVADKLDVTIDGSGSVFFNGSPLISTHINGTGRLIRF